MTPIIELKQVSKRYDGTTAVVDVSLTVEQGDLVVLLGPSGCGKTTTLRLLAGLEAPDSGEVWLNGQRVAGGRTWVPPENRRIGMVFQDYALFPHLTAAGNVAFPLNKLERRAREARVAEMLTLVGLSDKGERYPHMLSGGEQQRVALARALAANPAVVLLDEPFSNLDAKLRRAMREEVRAILRAAGATAIFVTHDQEEALSIADVLAVMQRGRLIQAGTPREVYLRPVSREVAAFMGDANFLPGVAEGAAVRCALGMLPLAEPARGEVEVMIRPESVVAQPDPASTAPVTGIVAEARFFGDHQIVTIDLPDGARVRARTWAHPDFPPGGRVWVAVRNAVLAYPKTGVQSG